MIAVCKDGRRTGCNYTCPNCVQLSKDLQTLPHLGPKPSLKTAAELAKLKATIIEKEETIKKQKTTEEHLLEIVETQKQELTDLKSQLRSDPAFHTVEYVEKKLEKKLEDFGTKILSTIKEEFNKSYAAAVFVDKEVVSSMEVN